MNSIGIVPRLSSLRSPSLRALSLHRSRLSMSCEWHENGHSFPPWHLRTVTSRKVLRNLRTSDVAQHAMRCLQLLISGTKLYCVTPGFTSLLDRIVHHDTIRNAQELSTVRRGVAQSPALRASKGWNIVRFRGRRLWNFFFPNGQSDQKRSNFKVFSALSGIV